MAVLVGHIGQIFIPNALAAWGALGTGAVMVFFVISGFFIRKSIEKGGDFIAARINRIAAPFAFAIILTVTLWFVAPLVFVTGDRSFAVPTTQQGYTLKNVVPTLFLVSWCIGGTIPANEPLWSLAYEVFYYALVAFRNVRIALLGLIAASVVNPAVGVLGAVWFAGFWIAKLHTEDRLPSWPQWPFSLLVIVAGALMLSTKGGTMLWWEVSVGLAFAAHLVWILGRSPPEAGQIAQTAEWSYTLYLIHYPLLLFAYGIGFSALPSAVGVLLLAALIGPRIERVRVVKLAAIAALDSSA